MDDFFRPFSHHLPGQGQTKTAVFEIPICGKKLLRIGVAIGVALQFIAEAATD